MGGSTERERVEADRPWGVYCMTQQHETDTMPSTGNIASTLGTPHAPSSQYTLVPGNSNHDSNL